MKTWEQINKERDKLRESVEEALQKQQIAVISLILSALVDLRDSVQCIEERVDLLEEGRD